MTTTCKSNHSNLHQAQVEQEGPEVILSHQESKSDPKIRQKIDLPGKAVLCQKIKKAKSLKSGKPHRNSTKIGPNPAALRLKSRSPEAISFFGRSSAQEARRRKRDVIRDVRPSTGRPSATSRRPAAAPAVEATPHQFLIHGVHPCLRPGGGPRPTDIRQVKV